MAGVEGLEKHKFIEIDLIDFLLAESPYLAEDVLEEVSRTHGKWLLSKAEDSRHRHSSRSMLFLHHRICFAKVITIER